MEMTHPMYDLSSIHSEDNSTERYEYKQYRETNVNVKDLSRYEIYTKDRDSKFRPKHAYIEVNGKILKPDGTQISTENVSLVNNGFNIFSRAELHIGQKLVELVEYAGITTTVRNLKEFSHEFSETTASNMLWHVDTSDTADRSRYRYDGAADKLETNATIKTYTSEIKNNKEFNEGHLKRYLKTKGSKQLNLWLPLSRLFGFCNDVDKILTGVEFKVILYKNNTDNMLLTDSNDRFVFHVNDISLWIPVVTPSLTTLASYETFLASGQTVDFKFETATCYRSDVRNDNGGSWRIASNQHAVSRVYIMFQKATRESNIKENNMIFDNMLLETSYVKVNGKQYPEEALLTSFNPDDLSYGRAYSNFLAAGYKDLGSELGTPVGVNAFAELYPIFCFDCSRHPDYTVALPVEVEFTWRLKNASNYRIYAVIESEVKAQLNIQDRKTFIIP